MIDDKNCWYDLKIDVKDAFREDFELPTPKGRYGIWHPVAWDVFNQDWLEYSMSIGLPIYSVMVFYRGPHTSTLDAHVDISRADPLILTNFGINWVYGGKGSSMSWYETPETKKPLEYTPAGTAYQSWPRKELKKIESVVIDEQVKLVRTGIPHSIEMGSEPRWCISARTSLHHAYAWNKVVPILRERNLLIERNV
jgi:hypothetical protein